MIYHDAGPDLHLFWPGNDAYQCAEAHVKFVKKFYGELDLQLKKVIIVPCYYEPLAAFGFAIWLDFF